MIAKDGFATFAILAAALSLFALLARQSGWEFSGVIRPIVTFYNWLTDSVGQFVHWAIDVYVPPMWRDVAVAWVGIWGVYLRAETALAEAIIDARTQSHDPGRTEMTTRLQEKLFPPLIAYRKSGRYPSKVLPQFQTLEKRHSVVRFVLSYALLPLMPFFVVRMISSRNFWGMQIYYAGYDRRGGRFTPDHDLYRAPAFLLVSFAALLLSEGILLVLNQL